MERRECIINQDFNFASSCTHNRLGWSRLHVHVPRSLLGYGIHEKATRWSILLHVQEKTELPALWSGYARRCSNESRSKAYARSRRPCWLPDVPLVIPVFHMLMGGAAGLSNTLPGIRRYRTACSGPPELTSSKQRIETNFSQTVLRTPCAMCGPLQRKNIHCNQSLLEAIGGLAVLPVRGYCMFDLIGIPLRQDR